MNDSFRSYELWSATSGNAIGSYSIEKLRQLWWEWVDLGYDQGDLFAEAYEGHRRVAIYGADDLAELVGKRD